MFMRHDTTGEIAMRPDLSSLVQILATVRRTTSFKLNRSITRKIASGCNGRAPLLATGHRKIAVRRVSAFRRHRAGMCCLAVSCSRLLEGA